MDLVQIKTVKGVIPIKGAISSSGDGLPTTVDSMVTFDIPTPIQLACSRQKGISLEGEKAALADLASCVQLRPEVTSPAPELFECARHIGPLFGSSNSESLRDWANAAYVAHLALRIQECVNGAKAAASLRGLRTPVKIHAASLDGLVGFDVLHCQLPLTGAYDEMLGGGLIVRRIEIAGRFLYSFAARTHDSGEQGERLLAVFVVSLDHELSFMEFDYLKDVISRLSNLGDEATDMLGSPKLRNEYRLDEDDAHYGSHLQGELNMEHADLSQSDLGGLEALVQTIAALHLVDVNVDVFRGTEDTGYLSFGNLLSYLWFDFARTSSKVSLGYCRRCGRAFSIAGHRGIKRVFCSEKCKTEEKNDRARHQTAVIRELFESGSSVREIAREVYGDREAGEYKVRTLLRSWPHLKHLIEASIQENGWLDSDILWRCESEGLEPLDLLNSKRKKEFKLLLERRSHIE